MYSVDTMPEEMVDVPCRMKQEIVRCPHADHNGLVFKNHINYLFVEFSPNVFRPLDCKKLW